jgi:hypothetical protein
VSKTSKNQCTNSSNRLLLRTTAAIVDTAAVVIIAAVVPASAAAATGYIVHICCLNGIIRHIHAPINILRLFNSLVKEFA